MIATAGWTPPWKSVNLQAATLSLWQFTSMLWVSVKWGDQSPRLLRLMMDDLMKHPWANHLPVSRRTGEGATYPSGGSRCPRTDSASSWSQAEEHEGRNVAGNQAAEPGTWADGDTLGFSPCSPVGCCADKVTRQALLFSFQKSSCGLMSIWWFPSALPPLPFDALSWQLSLHSWVVRSCPGLLALAVRVGSHIECPPGSCWCLFRITWAMPIDSQDTGMALD